MIRDETDATFTATKNGMNAVEITEDASVDASDCVELNSVGIEGKTAADRFVVYPNPTKGIFTFELDDKQASLTLNVLYVSGHVIMQEKYSDTCMVQLELNQPGGIYFLKLTDERGNREVLKLIKE